MSALQTVHVRVNDTATGQPIPCRIRFTDAAGVYYAPLGRLAKFATEVGIDVGGNVFLGDQAYAYIEGTCEIQLPSGRILVSIRKGPEYRTLQDEVILAPGKLALRFELERWTNLRAEGWYSGDTCCHELTPHAALLEAQAEDLAVVNLLARETSAPGAPQKGPKALTNILAFSGQRPSLERPGHLVAVNTLNHHPVLGKLLLLNCHRVVYPLTFGGPEGYDDWTLAAWCDQCHRKSGLVIGEAFFDAAAHSYGELLADLILGKVDALNTSSWKSDQLLETWYALLDLGFRIPLTGGSAKESNRQVLGVPRTFARLQPGEELTYRNWVEAVRAGRTFVTSGPLLLLTANGQDPGAVIDLPAGTPAIRVRAQARSPGALDSLELLANHKVVSHAQPGNAPLVLEAELTLPDGGWLLARCRGVDGEAMTSPIYVRVEGRQFPGVPTARAKLTQYLNKMLEWVEEAGRFERDSQHAGLAIVFQDACARLKNAN